MKLLTVFWEIKKANCKKTYLCDLSLAHFEVASVAVCNSDSFHVLSIIFLVINLSKTLLLSIFTLKITQLHAIYAGSG